MKHKEIEIPQFLEILSRVSREYSLRFKSDYLQPVWQRVSDDWYSEAPSSIFNTIKNRSSFNSRHDFNIRLLACELKSDAMFYHYMNMKKREEEIIGILQPAIEDIRLKGMMPHGTYATVHYPCEFEMEAFLLQARACLDTLASCVAYYFRNNCWTISKLPNILDKVHDDKRAKGILKILKAENLWMRVFVTERGKGKSRRDIVAHRGLLSHDLINIYLYPEFQKISLFGEARTEIGLVNEIKGLMNSVFDFAAQVVGVLFDFEPVKGDLIPEHVKF